MSHHQRRLFEEWLAQFRALWQRMIGGRDTAQPTLPPQPEQGLEVRIDHLLHAANAPVEPGEPREDSPTPSPPISQAEDSPPTEGPRFAFDEDLLHKTQAFGAMVKAIVAKDKVTKDVSAVPKARKPRTPQPTHAEVTQRKLAYVLDQINAIVAKKQEHMLYLVMYDIENNPLRTRFANYLEEIGLRRIQRSVFMGELDRRQLSLVQKAAKELQESYANQDSIIFLPISDDEAHNMYLVGKDLDIDFVLYRHHTLFF
jgi:CRISPR-associated protein Cas2